MNIKAKYAQHYDKDILQDVTPGLVLHLDPDVLEQEGGTYSCDPVFRVKDQHFFLCVSVAGELSRWIPLYTNPGDGRNLLTPEAKEGHPKWKEGQHYWHVDQVWEANSNAVYLAAGRAHDKTRRGTRNTIAIEFVPKI